MREITIQDSIMALKSSHSNTKLAILWKLLACFSYAAIAVLVRFLSKGNEGLSPLPINQIIFLENLIGLLIVLPFMVKKGLNHIITKEKSLQFLRMIFACAGIIAWYSSLKYMQIGYASALSFMGPIFTVMGGILFLKERLSPLKSFAILVSFTGAFLVIRPDQVFLDGHIGLLKEVGPFVLLPLFSALMIAGAKIVARLLSQRNEPAERMTFYLMLGLVPTTLIPALLSWTPINLMHLTYCAVLGATVIVAHNATALAYRYASVSFLTPFSFIRLMMSIGFGYIIFSEIPQQPTIWAGMTVILVSLFILNKPSPSPKSSKA